MLMRSVLVMSLFPYVVRGSHSLTVHGGYGGGTYDAGDLVHVFADIDPEKDIVTGWNTSFAVAETDGKYGVQGEWHFSFEMPAADIVLRPQIYRAPLSKEQLVDAKVKSQSGKDIPFWYYIPKNPVGLVGMFHGSKGSRGFLLKPQPWYTALKLVRAGYGIFAADSYDSARKAGELRWNAATAPFCSNQDLMNIKSILDKFKSMDLISNKTRLHAIGMSNGGVFTYSLVRDGGLGFLFRKTPPVQCSASFAVSAI